MEDAALRLNAPDHRRIPGNLPRVDTCLYRYGELVMYFERLEMAQN